MSQPPPDSGNPYQPFEPISHGDGDGDQTSRQDTPVGGSLFLDPSRRLRTVWRFLLFGLAMGVTMLGVSLVIGFILAIYLIANGIMPMPNPENAEAATKALEAYMRDHLLELTAINAIPITLFSLGIVLAFRKWVDRRTIASMGFVRPERRFRSSILVGFAAGFLPIVFGVGVVVLFGGYHFNPTPLSALTLIIIGALVLMAFFEEFVFRGYLLQNLVDIRQPVFGIVFTSGLFWIVHLLNPGAESTPFVALNLFGAGIVLALAYLASGNIWFPTAMHFAWNFTQGVLLGIPVSGLDMPGLINLDTAQKAPQWLTGGQFGFEGSAICTVVNVVLIMIFVSLLSSRRVDYADLVSV